MVRMSSMVLPCRRLFCGGCGPEVLAPRPPVLVLVVVLVVVPKRPPVVPAVVKLV